MRTILKNGRTILLVVLILAVSIFYIVQLYNIQIIKGPSYSASAGRSGTRTEVVEATRGLILDRNGKELAVNVLSRNIVIDKAYVRDSDLNEVILKLCNLLSSQGETWIDTLPIYIDDNGEYQFKENRQADISSLISSCRLQVYATAEQCIDALTVKYGCEQYSPEEAIIILSVRNEMRVKEYSFRYPYTFAKDVSIKTVSIIEENPDIFCGVQIKNTSIRQYVDGDLAPHIVGSIGAITAAQYAEKKDEGYSYNDVIGQFGIESKLESFLRGTNGVRTVTIDKNGNVTKNEITVEPIPGNTVYLSIDSELQRVAQKALKDNIDYVIESAKKSGKENSGEDCSGGAILILDCNTGEVLANVTYPSFDLSTYAEDLKNNSFEGVGALLNRALESVYPPGSVMKPAVALAGLNENVITANTKITCNRLYTRFAPEIFQCLGWHGATDVKYGLQKSCNCFFYETGYLLGISRMNQYCTMLGLGQKTGIELNEVTGTLAGPGTHSGGWYAGDTIQAAIGQSDNAFSAIQLAAYTATLANSGTRYKTTVLSKITDYSSTTVINDISPVVLSQINISEAHFATVRKGMRQAVTGGSVASVLGDYPVAIAGKTGTAQAGKGSSHGLLSIFAPYDDPEIAIVVVLEHGAHGYSAAYAVKDILDYYFGFLPSEDEQ